MYRLTTILICLLTLACHNRTETNNSANKTANTENKDNSCNCFDGIGSKKGDSAALTLNFTNAQNISVCGFVDKEMEGIIITEFNVFECDTGKSLTEYDAMQICRLQEKEDSLVIQELKYLPTGENWAWNLIQIGEEIITIKDGEIFATGNTPKLEKFTIDENDAKAFLDSLSKGKTQNHDQELEISKLEVLALSGNETAELFLENYEELTGQKTDGANAQGWKDAKATINWMKNKGH